MTLEELEKINEHYKDVNAEEVLESELKKAMSTILEKEHYKLYRKLDMFVLCPFFLTNLYFFISYLTNVQHDLFLRILIPINLTLSVISLILLLWNIFRIPKRIELFKNILRESMNEFIGIQHSLFEKITKPYLKIFFDYNLQIDPNFNTVDNKKEIGEKFLEIEDVFKPITDKYADLLVHFKNETIFKQPLKTDKYPKIEFFLDKLSDSFRYYFVVTSIFSLIIFTIYNFIINYWQL